MDDKELLNYVELMTFTAMLNGCSTLDHLGYTDITADSVGSWSVSLRADEVARLLDMAKDKNT
jgi:hypothetical protein